MSEVYLIKKNGKVIAHTDLEAMKELDGVKTPFRTVTEAEWEVAGSVAYVDNAGAIILGHTPEEELAQQKGIRRDEILRELNQIDAQFGPRPLRDIALVLQDQLAGGVTVALERIETAEARAVPLREELTALN